MRIRGAFTLFELILAIALSATLLALIGTAVNLYLVRMDSGRTRVEEAQLARSILSTIAADVRATTLYQTQDISTVEQLAQSITPFDPDAIDQAGSFDDTALGTPSGAGSPGSPSGTGTDSSSSSSSVSSGASLGDSQVVSSTSVPGLNGVINELLVDVSRLPRMDEMYPASAQQTSAAGTTFAANVPRPSDLKTVRYFIRQGTAIDPSDPGATLLSPQAQQAAGGLVRQTIDRAIREVAEQSADSALLSSGQVLLAPEVSQIQFIYFDGTTAVDSWDMQERNALPTAIDVRIWIAPEVADAETGGTAAEPRMYSETIELPLAQATVSSASTSGSEQSTGETSSTGEGSTTGDTGAGAFGSSQQ